MIEVMVDKVENGATYQGLVRDYWIYCTLKDSSQLKLFDYRCLIGDRYVGKRLEILAYMLSFILTEPEKAIGLVYCGTKKLPKVEYSFLDENSFNVLFHFFSNEVGLFYISLHEETCNDLIKGQTYYVKQNTRFDLIGFNVLDD